LLYSHPTRKQLRIGHDLLLISPIKHVHKKILLASQLRISQEKKARRANF